MSKEFQFDYYYGTEADQFTFYRIPKVLIKDKRFKGLSSDAKILYGLMLDRMSLSKQNGWIDNQNRVFIYYTLENIMEDLECGKTTCVKILAELDSKKGIGLIEKKRQGLGKPDIIYVKDFITCMEDAEVKVQKFGNETSRSSESELQEVQKMNFKNFENWTSGSSKNEPQEVQYVNPNNNNINNTEMNNNQSIYRMDESMFEKNFLEEGYKKVIRKNIEYDVYMQRLDYSDAGRYKEMYELICDVVCGENISLPYSLRGYSPQYVREKFLKLTSSHLLYVMSSYDQTVTKAESKYNYLMTALFKAVATMHNACQQDVSYALFGSST